MQNLPISKQVKAARVDRSENIAQVAGRAGIAYNTVSRIEEGGNIGTGNLEAITQSLGMALVLLPNGHPVVAEVANKLKAISEEEVTGV